MATINAYSAELTLSLLEDSSTVLTSPGSEETGTVTESFVTMPGSLAASASDVNIKLGALTDPLMLCIWGDDGVSFKVSSAGDSIAAYPFACLSDITNGLGISEIWLSNAESSSKSYTLVAIE